MTQVHSETTELQSQYAAQLTADLERNTKEQERISAEVTALQELLEALRRDQDLLVNLRRTLGDEAPAAAGAKAAEAAVTVASVPRQASAAPKSKPVKQQQKAAAAKPAKASEAVKATKPVKAVKTTSKSAGTKAAAKTPAPAPAAAGKPTLVELIHDHLSRQSEPRSAAEITSTLSETHPERGVKATVVRTTVEGLVAKGRAQRSKQGTSVYYTAAGTGAGDDSAQQAAPEQKTPVTD
ncbi:hypothetical protein [Streptomyces sp. NBC_01462]|uniref:hypothetical protein n=1 Tax=Streptomyces sp. NBC_01462 TaxID=2903876 RepID=UPI002E367BB0|nr:hypothetical protein [Streptomyces sp. NBC_01462]